MDKDFHKKMFDDLINFSAEAQEDGRAKEIVDGINRMAIAKVIPVVKQLKENYFLLPAFKEVVDGLNENINFTSATKDDLETYFLIFLFIFAYQISLSEVATKEVEKKKQQMEKQVLSELPDEAYGNLQ